ncbi:MAG: hypothetical protein ACNA8W_13325, partial [Bradymonadaceae bacterium]
KTLISRHSEDLLAFIEELGGQAVLKPLQGSGGSSVFLVAHDRKNVNQMILHPISILGILPTFYDMRNNISDESIKTLKGYFHDKVLPPIRVNTRLKEAPRHSQTIFEYAPESRGATDYMRLVNWVVQQQEKRLEAAV